MTIDVYTSTGTKKGTASLPKTLFEAPINEGLMHQAIVRQQSNRRKSIAHVKTRGEVRGSTRKMYRQKGTGRARRGSVRAPILRGGGKAFGPRNDTNFVKDMPKKMRRAALFSCLSLQAKNDTIIGLEGFAEEAKTKTALALLGKLPVEIGRRILFVTSEKNEKLILSIRNIKNVKVINAAYLNPEDILTAKKIIFVADSLKKAEEVFTTKDGKDEKETKEIKDSPKASKETKEAKEVKSSSKSSTSSISSKSSKK